MSQTATALEEPVISIQAYPLGRRKNYVVSFTSSKNTCEMKASLSHDYLSFRFIKGRRGTYIHGIKRGHGLMDGIVKTGNIPLFPVFAYKGEERFLYLSEVKEKSREFVELLSRDNIIANYSIRMAKDDEVADLFSGVNRFNQVEKLTSTEFRVVNEAYQSGYYEWPRVNDLSMVSSSLSLSKPTVLYHIRNAEKKIIGTLFNNRN